MSREREIRAAIGDRPLDARAWGTARAIESAGDPARDGEGISPFAPGSTGTAAPGSAFQALAEADQARADEDAADDREDDADPWPELEPEALHGIAGELVRLIEPATEADPVAILAQFFVGFGSCVGPTPTATADGKRHGINLNVALVGESAVARKGTAWARARPPLEAIDPDWAARRIVAGLSSGEGLVHAVRDPIEKNGELADEGERDKRLLVIEEEFASILRVLAREGNTLSPTLRSAWDGGTLRTLTKNNPACATGAHVSVIAHITRTELLKCLADNETRNGFGNRFLWLLVKRRRLLPDGGTVDGRSMAAIIDRLRDAASEARRTVLIERDEPARELWREMYGELARERPGRFGAMTSRAEAQALRLSLIYALLDGARVVRVEHLRAARALWRYCEESARYIFGDALGDALADKALEALRARPGGMTRAELYEHFQRHKRRGEIGRALKLLGGYRLARMVTVEDTGGRPAERWLAVGRGAAREKRGKGRAP